MKILHRYLISEFLKMFAMSLLLLCMLFFVSEFFFRLEDFVNYHASLGFVLKYMSLLPPMWVRDIMPMACFASIIFCLNKFSRNGEITAIKSCGINIFAFLVPVMIFAPVMAFFSVWLNMNIVPDSFYKSRVMREQTLKNVSGETKIYSNLTFKGSDGRIYVFSKFEPGAGVATGVVADRGLQERLIADKTAYKDGRWIMYNATWRKYSAGGKDILSERVYRKINLDIKEKPEDIPHKAAFDRQTYGDPNEMSTSRLLQYITKLKEANMPYAKESVAYHTRFSYPFASVIVVFLGIPFALGLAGRYEKIKGIGYVLVFSFLYWVLVSAGMVIGGSGSFISPFAGAWMANIIFSVAGTILFVKIRR